MQPQKSQALKMNNTKAFEAAKSVNRKLEFSGEDQESLLEQTSEDNAMKKPV